jgi:CheY-like chemotaxis protein
VSADPLELERARRAESERRQRILSEVSRVLLDYAGPDEAEPLRRVVDKVTETLGDWCAFSLVQPDGKLVSVAAYHPDPRQRELEKKLNALVPPKQWDAGPPAVNALVQRKPLVFENITEEWLRMDGWTLIRRMREERVAERVPLVIFSADRDTREKARALAADASLRKPFELQELQDVMERLLPQKPAA